MAGMNQIVERHQNGAGPRVLQILPQLGEGGAERGTIELARPLAARGWTAKNHLRRSMRKLVRG